MAELLAAVLFENGHDLRTERHRWARQIETLCRGAAQTTLVGFRLRFCFARTSWSETRSAEPKAHASEFGEQRCVVAALESSHWMRRHAATFSFVIDSTEPCRAKPSWPGGFSHKL